MKVLAIDPGEKVGYATGHIGAEAQIVAPDYVPVYRVPEIEVETHGIATLKDFALALHENAAKYDVIVYEDYRISPSKLKAHIGSNVPTLQLIGMIRLVAWLNPAVKLVVQQPAHKRTADKVIAAGYPDIAKRIADAPATHDDSHDTDALRHLAYWHWRTYA